MCVCVSIWCTAGFFPTVASHGEPLDHQGWVGQLTLQGVGRLSRAEVQVVGERAVRLGVGERERGVPVPLSLSVRPLRLGELTSLGETEVGLATLGSRGGACPLPPPKLALALAPPLP